MKSVIFAFAATLFLAACGSYPVSETSHQENVAFLYIVDAPANSRVIVDDQTLVTYDEGGSSTRDRIAIKPGVHSVRIAAADGTTLFEREVFLDQGSTRKINLDPDKRVPRSRDRE